MPFELPGDTARNQRNCDRQVPGKPGGCKELTPHPRSSLWPNAEPDVACTAPLSELINLIINSDDRVEILAAFVEENVSDEIAVARSRHEQREAAGTLAPCGGTREL